MAITNKIMVGIDDQVIELIGKDKEAFLEQREADKIQAEKRQAEAQAQLELKKSALTKLGLTEDEINAIL